MWECASIPQWPRAQSARRAGDAWAAVRLVMACTVTARQRRPAGGRTRRVMRSLGGVGEVQASDGGDLELAGLDAAVAAVAGVVGDGDLTPGQGHELLLERGLVGLTTSR